MKLDRKQDSLDPDEPSRRYSPPRSGCRPTAAGAIRQLSRLFWDQELREEHLDRYPLWVVERVLEYGQLEDVHVLVDLLGRRRFLELVRDSRRLTPRTQALWNQILKREGFSCTR